MATDGSKPKRTPKLLDPFYLTNGVLKLLVVLTARLFTGVLLFIVRRIERARER